MLPKRNQAVNLLVTGCFSASHVAYSSLRMEPQNMILGHAAGVAASLALKSGKPVQEISVAALQEKLKSQGAVFDWAPSLAWPSIFLMLFQLYDANIVTRPRQ